MRRHVPFTPAAAYSAYWRLIRERAFTDVKLAAEDDVAPASALTATALPPDRWHRGDVTLKDRRQRRPWPLNLDSFDDTGRKIAEALVRRRTSPGDQPAKR